VLSAEANAPLTELRARFGEKEATSVKLAGSHRPGARGLACLAVASLFAITLASVSAASAATTRHARPPAGTAATVELTGQVRNGNAVYDRSDTKIVVPAGLPVVAHATVHVPQLSLSAVTNSHGGFAFRIPAAQTRAAVTVEVTAKGFGSWRESGVKLAATGSTSLYVQLDHARQALTAPRPQTQRFNGPGRLRLGRGTRTAAGPAAYTSCGHNSSGWTSQLETPPAIRVYMTETGDIVDYSFLFYEEHVLPNEWGSGAPYAALEAGAEAVRDYAWYFVLNGSKGTAADVNPCSFDVDDTTAYQDFVPSAPAYSNTNDAITTTATTVFSQNGNIPETSFCSNFVTSCGADSPPDYCGELANGSSMSQIGSDACADDGDSWQQILAVYYYPGFSLKNVLASYVFWRGGPGSKYALYQAQGPANAGLSGPTDRGMGPLGSAPAVAVGANGYTYVYWEGTGPQYDLWEAYWNGSKWVGPYNRGMGPLDSAPSVAIHGSTAYVFWRGGPASKYALYEAQGPADGTLSGPTDRGMGPLGSAPAAGIDADGNTYVYWEGTSPQDDLWEGFWNGSEWVGPYNRGMGPLNTQPTVAVYPN
jgi:hypothetical protein